MWLTYSENTGNPYFRLDNVDQLKNCLHLSLFMHVYVMMSYYGKYLILGIFLGVLSSCTVTHGYSLLFRFDMLPPCKIIFHSHSIVGLKSKQKITLRGLKTFYFVFKLPLCLLNCYTLIHCIGTGATYSTH